jgi:tetrahydrodipicolinate N-succinyltransferase
MGGFYEAAVEIASGDVTYMPSFINIGSGVDTDTQAAM